MGNTNFQNLFASLGQKNSNNPQTLIGAGEYYLDSSILGSTNKTSSVDLYGKPINTNTHGANVNTNGTLESDYGTDGSGIQLDQGFEYVDGFYTYLAEADGNKKNGISEETFDNLYYTITGKKSDINFSVVFGGGDSKYADPAYNTFENKIDSYDELSGALIYLESLDTKDVFKFIKENPDYSKQKNYFKPVLELQVKTLDFTLNPDGTRKDPATKAIETEFSVQAGWHKYVNVLGIPIFADKGTTDAQLIAIGEFLNDFLEDNEDIRQQWIKNNHKVSIDAEGSGVALFGTTVANSTDPNLLFHEMLHSVDQHGFTKLYPEYTNELFALYEQAWINHTNPKSPWFNKDVAKDSSHFLIHLVESYYDMGTGASNNKNLGQNQAEFKTKFPKEYAFIKKYFGESSNLKLPKSWG